MECVISGFRDGIGQGFDLGFCVDVDSYLVELDDWLSSFCMMCKKLFYRPAGGCA